MSDQNQQKIFCSINNCHYWGQNNTCKAKRIMVTSDEITKSMPDSIDAPMVSQFPKTPISTCDQSACKTFVTKTDFNRFEDGVTK